MKFIQARDTWDAATVQALLADDAVVHDIGAGTVEESLTNKELDEAFRVLEALEDARLTLREGHAAPGLQDELATVIRMLHGKLGLDEGGVL